jgi:hypothetical protein
VQISRGTRALSEATLTRALYALFPEMPDRQCGIFRAIYQCFSDDSVQSPAYDVAVRTLWVWRLIAWRRFGKNAFRGIDFESAKRLSGRKAGRSAGLPAM